MIQAAAVLDAHVHIHDCYDIDTFFDNAFRNLSRAQLGNAKGSPVFYLLMTECAGDDYFGALRELASGAPASRGSSAAARLLSGERSWSAGLGRSR